MGKVNIEDKKERVIFHDSKIDMPLATWTKYFWQII